LKVKPQDADRFAAKPPAGIVAVLVYGPDAGLVRQRIESLALSVLDDLADPFRLTEISDSDLKSDPARLADEAASISMLGGRRVVRLRGIGDSATKTVTSFLENPIGDALVLAEGGELGPRSSLRLLFEEAENAAALPCYADDAGTLGEVIRARLGAAGLKTEPAALDYLLSHLGSDRGVTQNELEKLVLYMGMGEKGATREVTLADARDCIGDNAASNLDAVIDATLGGELEDLDTALARARAADTNAIVILNALSRHLMQLQLAAARVETGSDVGGAIRSFRPPLHFKRKDAVTRQMKNWNRRKLDRALALALEAEGQCKTTGNPAEAICGQTLFRIAQGARPARR
jgi:DNA polymerase-3 subunit delta